MTMATPVFRRVRLGTFCSSFFAVVLSAGAASAGSWQPAGVGDCPGRDVGGSRGPTPEAAKCDAGFAGQTAVCWANGCTYKNVSTSSCKGGTSPGQMYTCVAGPAAAPTAPAAWLSWQSVGLGDCPGRDVGASSGPAPDAAKCNASFAGQTAICWTTGCTYKTVATSACTGGSSPGQMYTCGTAAPQAPAAAPQPTGPTWQAMGVGDCPGRDVSGSAGSNPDPSKCNAAFAGQTAVCWTTGCAYKNVATAACTGGANPGQLYTCAVPGGSSAPAAAGRNNRAPAAPPAGWQPVGTGDCLGHDVGGTAGPTPDASKCDAAFAGQTAICWSNGCMYKNIATSACTGGTSPGQMFTCNPGAPGAFGPPPPPPGPPKVNGRHYLMVNYTGETQNPHDFVIDWKGCKVAEMGADYQNGAEEITVQVCKPGARMVIKTEFKNSGYWVQYDWVLLDNGATLAGAYRDPAGCGPSAGKRAR
jgi:hypothetical protein